jgi:broad specificity phosphatase PhoE
MPSIDPKIPSRDWHLSQEGRQRGKLLAARLLAFSPMRIVSSHESKALETASIVAETIGLPYEEAVGLQEHERSQEEYTSREIFENQVRIFFGQPGRLVFGSETADQACTRFIKAVKAIQEQVPGQFPLVIVSHGTVISLFVSRAWGIDPFLFWKSLQLPCIVEFSTGKPNIISLDTHLSLPPDR